MYKKFWQRIQPPPACRRDMVKDTSRSKYSSSSSSMTAATAATAVLLLVGGAAAGYSCSTRTNTESYRHGYQQHHHHQQQQCTHRPLGINNNNNKNNNNRKRTYKTRADEYYQKYGKIPLPRVVHAVWNRQDDPNHCSNNNNNVRCSSSSTSSSHKILIVGDVHGCLEELIALVTKASMLHNDHQDFAAVILVGDLCNKGPYSAEVIRYVRKKSCQQQQQQQQQQQMSVSKKTNDCCWFAVRGNHDDAALAAALGDVQRRQCKEKYGWVVDSLSDEDVEWMSDLPYTIRIPCCRNGNCTAAEWSNNNVEMDKRDDVIVVHAGLLPGIPLHEQTVETMTTIRNVNRVQAQEKDEEEEQQTQQQQQQQNQQREETSCAWAKLWHGPELVIFGHDAKRGLQKERYAIGLDTGACYGKKLTGIVLPEQEVVSVDSFQTYCKIREK